MLVDGAVKTDELSTHLIGVAALYCSVCVWEYIIMVDNKVGFMVPFACIIH